MSLSTGCAQSTAWSSAWSGLPYEHLRRITACSGDPREIELCTGSKILQDFKDNYLVAFGGEWSVGFLTKHNPGLELSASLSV